MKLPLGYWQAQYRDHMVKVLGAMTSGLDDPSEISDALAEEHTPPTPEQLASVGLPDGDPLTVEAFVESFGTALNRNTVHRWMVDIRDAESPKALRDAVKGFLEELELLHDSCPEPAEQAIFRSIIHTTCVFAWAARAHEACFRACPFPARFLKACPIEVFFNAACNFRLQELLSTLQAEKIVGDLPPDITGGPDL